MLNQFNDVINKAWNTVKKIVWPKQLKKTEQFSMLTCSQDISDTFKSLFTSLGAGISSSFNVDTCLSNFSFTANSMVFVRYDWLWT